MEKFNQTYYTNYFTEKNGSVSYDAVNWKKDARDIMKKYTFNSFLDVGCGLGNFVHELKLQGKFAIGLENSTYAVKEAAKKGYPVIALNIGTQQFPFPDNSFDIVHCFTTLEYLKTEKEIIHAMKEMSRVCKHTIIFSARFSNTDRITNHDNHTNRTFDFQTEKFWRTLWKRSANNKKLVIIDDEY